MKNTASSHLASLCFPLLLSVAVATVYTQSACAVLTFVSDDAANLWPASAPVRTSVFVPTGGASTRGVRGNRLQYQTFEVTEAFSLDKILIEYGWAGGTTGGSTDTNFTKVRLLAIERTFNPPELEDAFNIVSEVIPQLSFIVSSDDKVVNNFYAIELAWDPEMTGELTLPARTGSQAYALEINGTHDGQGSSAINLIERPTNPYPPGRAYEFQGVGQTGPFGTGLYDFPIVLTAVPVPPLLTGDYNGDGTVDAADYVQWRNGGPLQNDPTEGVQETDYDVWVANFGETLGGGTAMALNSVNVVPEPGLLAIVCGALVAPLMWRRRVRHLGGAMRLSLLAGTVVTMTTLCATANATFVLANFSDLNAAYPSYPSGAPVVTAALPASLVATQIDSRGMRSDRVMAQTFQVPYDLRVENIYLGYDWNATAQNIDKTLSFRILLVDDVFVNPAYALPGIPIPGATGTIAFGTDPAAYVGGALQALKLTWTGGSPLTLTTRTGNQGYALEFVGSASGNGTIASTIAPIRYLTGNPYGSGRLTEQTDTGGASGGGAEWVVAITGQAIPEPSAFLYGSMCAVLCGLAGLRRRVKTVGSES